MMALAAGNSSAPGFSLAAFVWHDRAVRTRILMSFAALSLAAFIFAAFVALLDAKKRVEAETRSPLTLAERYITEAARHFGGEAQTATALPRMLALQLRHLRHLEVKVLDAGGNVVTVQSSMPQDASARAPGWFVNLVGSAPQYREVPLTAGGRHSGTVVLRTDAADELGEVWNDFMRLGLVWFAANAAMMAVFYVVLGRILRPLVRIAEGMHELETGDYRIRMEAPRVPELVSIAANFNNLAAALSAARMENSQLYQELMSVQEDERRQIASDLHDEAGPCLFGITTTAAAIEARVARIAPEQAGDIGLLVAEIAAIVQRLKAMNRQILKRLRPMALGKVTLSELILELIADFQRRYPEVEFQPEFGELARSYGTLADLTIYRCVQEGVTNALRHGEAALIRVQLGEEEPEAGARRLSLTLSDNGKGLAATSSIGFGLAVMRERVQALGGNWRLSRTHPSGAAITAIIPISGQPARVTTGNTPMTTVLVIDDHPIVLQGFARVLEAHGAGKVVPAATMSEGFRLYRSEKPDIIIADLTMSTGLLSGLSFIRRIRVFNARIPILVLSMHRDPVIVSRALQAGATGYVLKDSASEDPLKAFHRVREGKVYISDDLTADLVLMETRGQSHRLQKMTLRELELLSILAEGKPYGLIAEELNVSYKTVANSVAIIKNKLGVRTLPELIRIAIDQLPSTTMRSGGGRLSGAKSA